MNILVYPNNIDINQQKKAMVSKEIICPECKENTLIDIKNYKINLSGYKNKHEIKDIILYKY